MNAMSPFYDYESSSDDEMEIEYILSRRPKVFRQRSDHFQWDDVDFFARFRMSKETVLRLIDLIKEDLERPSTRNHAVTPTQRVLTALRFYATGVIQQCTGDLSGLHKSTVSRIVFAVTKSIYKLRQRFISMPSNSAEIDRCVVDFYKIAKLPNVLGAIDCTCILNPGGENGENYRNRKAFFSFNVQVIVNADMMIMDIVARWPGSAHDSTIFNMSNVKIKLERGDFGSRYLVGDRGYALKTYLMTPLSNPVTVAERLYNESQIRTRNVVERTFGVWKRRFPAIGSKLRISTERVQPTIVATAILHNICVIKKNNQIMCNVENDNTIDDIQINEQERTNGAASISRNQLIEGYFFELANEEAHQTNLLS